MAVKSVIRQDTGLSRPSRKWVALVCLTLFLSLFALENVHPMLNQDVLTEIVDFENTDSEQDSKKGEQETDKLTSKTNLLHLQSVVKAEYNVLLLKRRADQIQEVVSPPPEA